MNKEGTAIAVDISPNEQVKFAGQTLEEAKRQLSDWLTDGRKDMVAFPMTDEDGDWLVCLVHIADGSSAGEWRIVDAPSGVLDRFDRFEEARDQFVELAGIYAIDPTVKQEHLLVEVMFLSNDE